MAHVKESNLSSKGLKVIYCSPASQCLKFHGKPNREASSYSPLAEDHSDTTSPSWAQCQRKRRKHIFFDFSRLVPADRLHLTLFTTRSSSQNQTRFPTTIPITSFITLITIYGALQNIYYYHLDPTPRHLALQSQVHHRSISGSDGFCYRKRLGAVATGGGSVLNGRTVILLRPYLLY